jgi:hypothetical protein
LLLFGMCKQSGIKSCNNLGLNLATIWLIIPNKQGLISLVCNLRLFRFYCQTWIIWFLDCLQLFQCDFVWPVWLPTSNTTSTLISPQKIKSKKPNPAHSSHPAWPTHSSHPTLTTSFKPNYCLPGLNMCQLDTSWWNFVFRMPSRP